MKKKSKNQGSLNSPLQDETQAPDIQTDDPLRGGSLRQSSTNIEKRESHEQMQMPLKKHWLAPAGSMQERVMLEDLAKQHQLSNDDRILLDRWLKNPQCDIDRNAAFWGMAKRLVLGSICYEKTMKRQKSLPPNEWLVAYFTSQGIQQKEIAYSMHVHCKTVDNIIRKLKDKILAEFHCEIETVTIAQIARWFLGA